MHARFNMYALLPLSAPHSVQNVRQKRTSKPCSGHSNLVKSHPALPLVCVCLQSAIAWDALQDVEFDAARNSIDDVGLQADLTEHVCMPVSWKLAKLHLDLCFTCSALPCLKSNTRLGFSVPTLGGVFGRYSHAHLENVLLSVLFVFRPDVQTSVNTTHRRFKLWCAMHTVHVCCIYTASHMGAVQRTVEL